MKKSYLAGLVVAFSLITASCNNQFLDKAPGVDLTEDNAFQNKASLETFMATIYQYAMNSNFRYRLQNNLSTTVTVSATDVIHPSASISDEGDASEASFVNNNRWNEGNVLPSNIVSIEDFRYYIRWIALRQIALVLKRIDEVPDADQAYKDQIVGEVRFLRAMNYMEMVKRYGGVPIVDKVYAPLEKVDVPRSSLEDCIKFIVADCDAAFPKLPASYSPTQTGRVPALAALALKSEALLYAASPQYNTATPYISMANAADNKLICYGNYDVNRWKLAADAAKAALDYALSHGYGLIDDPASRNPKELDNGTPGPSGNYRDSWEISNNKETILMYQGVAPSNISNAPLTFFTPTSYGAFWCGISVPLNFLKKYEKLDGTSQTWDDAGGTDLIAKYAELDPRFKQTLNYTNSYFNAQNPISLIYDGGKDYKNCKGGTWMRKYISRAARTGGPNVMLNDILFRVNELYLNYAEALNEFAGPSPEAYTAVNTIRTRSGMPNLPTGLSQTQFRTRVRNEIAIEMAYDDHRFWDIKRWLIAEDEGVMKGNFQGLQITKVGNLYNWKPYTFEVRQFNKQMYLHPFPQTEVLKGNLIQNPGW